MATTRDDGTNPRARGTNPRAITREWTERIENDLGQLKADMGRLLAHHGLGTGQTPNTVTREDGRIFLPGTGWIADDAAPDPPAHWEPRASEETAYAALAAMRNALHNRAHDGGDE